MARAIWKDTVAAKADRVEMIEGTACLPPEASRQAASIGDMVAVRRGVEVAP